MVPAGNKAKRFSSVNHTAKAIHHSHHHQSTEVNFARKSNAEVHLPVELENSPVKMCKF